MNPIKRSLPPAIGGDVPPQTIWPRGVPSCHHLWSNPLLCQSQAQFSFLVCTCVQCPGRNSSASRYFKCGLQFGCLLLLNSNCSKQYLFSKETLNSLPCDFMPRERPTHKAIFHCFLTAYQAALLYLCFWGNSICTDYVHCSVCMWPCKVRLHSIYLLCALCAYPGGFVWCKST